MKLFPAIALFALTLPAVAAEVIGPGCGFEIDYPAAELPRIDGFQLFVNGTKTATLPATTRAISCADAKVIEGTNAVKSRAYSGKNTSPFSNELTFKYSAAPLVAPSAMRIVIEFPGVVK